MPGLTCYKCEKRLDYKYYRPKVCKFCGSTLGVEQNKFEKETGVFDRMMLIEARVGNERRSVGLAYVLWIFFGFLGIHNFYLRRPVLALFQLLGTPVGIFLIMTMKDPASRSRWILGLVFICLVALSLIIDLFVMPRVVRRQMNAMRRRMNEDLVDNRH